MRTFELKDIVLTEYRDLAGLLNKPDGILTLYEIEGIDISSGDQGNSLD